MTDDLVKRLLGVSIYDPHEAEALSEEAASRIEKLEAALRWIVEQEKQTAHPTVCEIVRAARKALEGKDD